MKLWVKGFESYGLWVLILYEPTWENPMGFEGLWVIRYMEYKGVDCSLKQG